MTSELGPGSLLWLMAGIDDPTPWTYLVVGRVAVGADVKLLLTALDCPGSSRAKRDLFEILLQEVEEDVRHPAHRGAIWVVRPRWALGPRLQDPVSAPDAPLEKI